MNEVIFGFIIGTLVAACLVIFHIISQAIKREYFDVGIVALPIKETDPELYMALYKAKQHARRVTKPQLPQGSGIRARIMNIYVGFQPDSRYLRLERNLTKLVQGTISDERKHAATIRRCKKDLAFLDAKVDPPPRPKLFAGMALAVIRCLFIPRRDGPTEPDTPQARSALKAIIETRITSYSKV